MTTVVPGNFDGVHAGHRQLIADAMTLGMPTVALTFDPHPVRHFRPERALPEITSLDRRVELLLKAGAKTVAVANFDDGFAAQSPAEFAAAVFREALGAAHVVVGADFRFGHKREGDLATLRALGATLGFRVDVEAPVFFGERVVSSTWVREAIAAGDIDVATRLLGRPHDVEGVVVHGEARGRTIGFPTANLNVERGLLPAHGVYAIVARDLDDPRRRLLRGVANLGVRPTFAAGFSLEAHFADFDGDLYGKRLRVAFGARLRGERKFDGIDALKAQIAADVRDAAGLTLAHAKEWSAWI